MLDTRRPVKSAALGVGALLLLFALAAPAAGFMDETPALFALDSPVGPIRYAPGRGLHVGDTGLHIGGYGNIDLERDEGEPGRLRLGDLAALVRWAPLPRLHFFSEFEGEDLLEVDTEGGGGTTAADFALERLYGEALVSDRLSVRVGKFFTPVGRWNVIHAEPLVWTTSRPLVTFVPFDSQTTGAMLSGTFFTDRGALTYSAYGQFVDQLAPSGDGPTAQRSGGGRLEYDSGSSWSLGTSFLSFSEHGEWQRVFGCDGLWRHGGAEVMGEAAYIDAPSGRSQQWGLYLQGVYPILKRLYAVGRYEHFDLRAPEPEVDLFVTGAAYKPRPYLVLKLEYLFATHFNSESPPGVKASVAALF